MNIKTSPREVSIYPVFEYYFANENILFMTPVKMIKALVETVYLQYFNTC